MKHLPKILVVDDKHDIVETVTYCLAEEGFDVSSAFDGREALDKARAESPDLIVLDVMLPRENGYQVARFLREDHREGRLATRPKILLLTARTVSDRQREDFLKTWSGADAMMYKPFDLEALVERIRSLLDDQTKTTKRSNGIDPSNEPHQIEGAPGTTASEQAHDRRALELDAIDNQ